MKKFFVIIIILFSLSFQIEAASLNDIQKQLKESSITNSSKKEIKKSLSIKPKFKVNKANLLISNNFYKTIVVKNETNEITLTVPKPVAPSKPQIVSKVPAKVKKSNNGRIITAPLRISEDDQETPAYPGPINPMEINLKPFPSIDDFPKIDDQGLETKGIALVNEFYNSIQSSSEAELNSLFLEIITKYAQYSYITALAKFYYIENQLFRSNGYVYSGTHYNELYLQIVDVFSGEYNKNKIFEFVINKSKERIAEITKNSEKLITENNFLKWNIKYLENEKLSELEKKIYFEGGFYSGPKADIFENIYNNILDKYKTVIKNYFLAGQTDKAMESYKEYENFYENVMKRKFYVLCDKYDISTGLTTRITKEIEIKRYPEDYLYFIKNDMIQNLEYFGETAEKSDYYKEQITYLTDKIKNYRRSDVTSNVPVDEISEDVLQNYIAHAYDQSNYGIENYYKNNVEIVSLIFTRSECLYLNYRDIFNSDDLIILRAIGYRNCPLYSFTPNPPIKISSNTSQRSREINSVMKLDRLYGNFYTTFHPNEKKESQN